MDRLPDEVLIEILRRLPFADRYSSALTCRCLFRCFQSAVLWRDLELDFVQTDDVRALGIVEHHGADIQRVVIRVDQSNAENRQRAVSALSRLAAIEDRQLVSLTVTFVGTNPLFYGGQEFAAVLHDLFGEPTVQVKRTLEYVDLSKLPIMQSDELFYALAAHHGQTLRYLDIQNQQLVCRVSAECVHTLVRRCTQLVDLRIFYSTFSADIIRTFIDDAKHRAPLRHLSLLGRRQDKYNGVAISDEAWQQFRAVTKLVVTLKFDHTCPLWKVNEIMQPSVPVENLYLETYTRIVDQLQLVITNYSSTLRKLVAQTQPSDELDAALILLCECALMLQSLHVMCTLGKATVERIRQICPKLQSATLKFEAEAHPWTSDDVLDEIQDHWK